MNPNISSSLDRADELLNELETEYNRSLELKQVSPRAVQITHEVCEKLRGILDRIARRYWEQYVAPELSPDCNERATVYFPISPDQSAFDSTIGDGNGSRYAPNIRECTTIC